jgi:hypothetical protein
MKTILTTIILGVIPFTVAFTAASGCSQHVAKESFDGTTYKSEVKSNLFFYWSKSKEIEHVTPYSSTCVGELHSYPDPNSIEAVSEGVVTGLVGGGV